MKALCALDFSSATQCNSRGEDDEPAGKEASTKPTKLNNWRFPPDKAEKQRKDFQDTYILVHILSSVGEYLSDVGEMCGMCILIIQRFEAFIP